MAEQPFLASYKGILLVLVMDPPRVTPKDLPKPKGKPMDSPKEKLRAKDSMMDFHLAIRSDSRKG